MMVELYLLKETAKARLYSLSCDGEGSAIWVPKSLIEDCLKWPAKKSGELERHQLELPEWFCNQNEL